MKSLLAASTNTEIHKESTASAKIAKIKHK
jgi:hypothetical protein